MYKILIIEDDEVIASGIARHLTEWNYNTRVAKNFHALLREFLDYKPHLVLLDISLPVINGYRVCADIRAVSHVPVVFLSSASENLNIVMAMNMGGDDFISKPFDIDVLCAKVGAIIRRAYSSEATMEVIMHAGVMLDTEKMIVNFNGRGLELTKNEFRILHVLIESAGRVVSRDKLCLRLWESDSFIDDNTLSVNVARLRKKLESIGLFNFIETKKGVGYTVK